MTFSLLLIGLFVAGSDRTEGAVATRTGRVLTWGSALLEWTVQPLHARTIRPGPFGEGGCLTDLDRDGRQEFVAVRGSGLGNLLWMPLATATEERIDDQVEMGDCTEAVLFGRRGLLMIHRGAQVRFYERNITGKWSSRDIYSIYTPSYQRGLAVADVNGDGRADIFCGNYWIASPRRFDESWRLFAIHTWFEEPNSAALRIAVMGVRRIAAGQARLSPARFAIFDAPSNPRLPWTGTNIPHKLGKIKALAYSGGELVAGGEGGFFIGGRIVSTAPVDALAPLSDGTYFVLGPRGAAVVGQRSRRR